MKKNCESNLSTPIVIFIHIHYLDVWKELENILVSRINVPFRLVITSSIPKEKFSTLISPFLVEETFISTQNRGRDILPFIIAYSCIGNYEIGLKLHTKRSKHLVGGDRWRAEIVDSLLPPQVGVSEIVDTMIRIPKIGFISPRGLFLPLKAWMLKNRRGFKLVAKILSLPIDRKLIKNGYFAAGSMFWFRREALLDFQAAPLVSIFEDEAGQVDGTIGHAIERLFAYATERRGYAALPMDVISEASPDMPEMDLWNLSRSRSLIVSEFFIRPSPVHHFVGRYAPFLFSVYRQLPKGFRKRLRDRLLGIGK